MDLLGFLGNERISQIADLASKHTDGKYNNVWQRQLMFEKATGLRKVGTGYGSIARELEVSKGQVVNWLTGRHEPLRRHVVPIVGPDFAYVVGAWLGDGGQARDRKRWRHYTKLVVKDADFAQAFAVSLASCLGRKRAARMLPTKDGRLTTYVNNRMLYDFLKSCKLRLELAEPVADEYPGNFLRGFWDAEGNIDVTPSQNKIQAYNTDEGIVELAVRALDKVGIHHTMYPRLRAEFFRYPGSSKIFHRNHRVMYTIHIRSCCHLRFQRKIGLTIERKLERLRIVVAARPKNRSYCSPN